jgi:hypothetical protein
MSSESRTNTDATGHGECTACGATLQERRLALQSYPESTEATLSALSAGGLLYCPGCGAEPVELLDSWTGHERPPIDGDRQIGAGYREPTDQCSFCTDELGSDPVVGIELYRRPGETLPAYANYTLCGDCRTVFEEFLENVSGQ